MRSLLFTICSIALLACTSSTKVENSGKITVIELFTSEGCSSCPSAEDLFNDISKTNYDQKIYALEFHVDYWDRLGWKDPYSLRSSTDRQNGYARKLSLESIYTPQMVVNGKSEFVGSDRSQLTKALSSPTKPDCNISLSNRQISGKQLSIDYSASGDINGKEITLFLILKQATTDVRRGENSGRKLLHKNIVVEIGKSVDMSAKGTIQLEAPASYSAEKYDIIALSHDKGTGSISGAAELM